MAAGRPGLFLRDRGADRDPWRGPGRPRGTLHGPAAARVVRALIDFAPPYTVPELSERAGASTGATYRVVEFLEGEGLMEPARYGPIGEVQWRPLLERWSKDYGFAQSNTVDDVTWSPAGWERSQARLPNSRSGLRPDGFAGRRACRRLCAAATGDALCARHRRCRRRARAARTDKRRQRRAGLRQVRRRLRPRGDGGRLRFGALSQVAVDLLTGPGRNPSEANALLDWMTQ